METTKPFLYLSLDHVIAFISHLKDTIECVNLLLLPGSLQLYINGNEAACLSNSITAVNQDWFIVAVGMGLSDPPKKVEQRGGVMGNIKIDRPGSKMKLLDYSHLLRVDLVAERRPCCISPHISQYPYSNEYY